jgi:hypothetical protein
MGPEALTAEQIDGQMTVEDCIAVAAAGSDGRPAVDGEGRLGKHEELSTAAEGAPLVFYGQKSGEGENWGPPSPCPRATRHLRMRAPDGSWIALRCKRRGCPYCGRLADYELLQCLLIDAREELPALVVTLTTVQPWCDAESHHLKAVYREASAQLWRALRGEFGSARYFGSIEFTTGEAATSGGHRRMHGHYLVKDLDPAMCERATELGRDVWERVTGAWRVQFAPLASAGGIVGYLALHHRKREQLPPPAWRGMTARASQRPSYWHRPIAEIRDQARREQAIRRTAWRFEREGATRDQAAVLAPLEVDHRREEWAAHTPELVNVHEGPVPTPAQIR